MMDVRKPLILLGDRDLGWSLPLRKRLRGRGLRVATATSAQSLLTLVRGSLPDLVVPGESLDDFGSRLLAGLVQEESPESRLIRVLPSNDPARAEPGPADNVLCTMTRSAPPEQLSQTIDRVLKCFPRAPQRSKAPLVVCVDDDRLFLDFLARSIRRQGYRVLTYQEPELALEELPLVEPELLILDVLMPGLSGFEVLDEVRRYYRASLPVLLLSALDSDEKIARGNDRGAAGYLTKPCAPETLLESVHRLLARSGTARKDMKSPGWVSRESKGPQERSGERSTGHPPPPSTSTGLKPGGAVLCVDDEPEILSALRRILHREPYRVVTANDAVMALDCLDRNPVQVVIADERMPGMSGSELLGEVRRRWPRIGRVILTGYPGHEVMTRGLEAGVDFLLYKPWDDEALRNAVLRLVQEVERSRSEALEKDNETTAFDLGGEGG